jgi:phosphoglycerate dehydrogenase-like enzyme
MRSAKPGSPPEPTRRCLPLPRPNADIILNAMFTGDLLRLTFPLASKVQWVHSLSAGVEHVMFPELLHSPVPLTNGRGVFRRSLGEFVLAALDVLCQGPAPYGAQPGSRNLAAVRCRGTARAHHGIVGYGEIGRAAAERAKPFGMSVIAIRRRPDLSASDALLDGAYAPALNCTTCCGRAITWWSRLRTRRKREA